MTNTANMGQNRAMQDAGDGGLPMQGFQGQGSNRQDQPNQIIIKHSTHRQNEANGKQIHESEEERKITHIQMT